MFLVDWFRGILASLAVWRKEAKILFLGLDNGGKTTLLRMLTDEKELDALLSDDSLTNVPFLILGNKIDILNAASENELRYFLGLADSTTGKGQVNLEGTNVRPLEVFMCSIVRKMGYGEGFQWLCQYIK
ncbi:hypothetical protein CRG98_038914 [Punica granatum]|uniref:GTP-binding protein SAR1A-like n=1 Tax=Punica granatum TaxID=22663 RepID=A0A2I0I9I7_PUNGR|nr:hypothetical protein CRG98_038914 [Punica granatum]